MGDDVCMYVQGAVGAERWSRDAADAVVFVVAVEVGRCRPVRSGGSSIENLCCFGYVCYATYCVFCMPCVPCRQPDPVSRPAACLSHQQLHVH